MFGALEIGRDRIRTSRRARDRRAAWVRPTSAKKSASASGSIGSWLLPSLAAPIRARVRSILAASNSVAPSADFAPIAISDRRLIEGEARDRLAHRGQALVVVGAGGDDGVIDLEGPLRQPDVEESVGDAPVGVHVGAMQDRGIAVGDRQRLGRFLLVGDLDQLLDRRLALDLGQEVARRLPARLALRSFKAMPARNSSRRSAASRSQNGCSSAPAPAVE